MKLIIDIPENEYRHIKEYYEKNDIVEATYSYIYHGKPLDGVLKEIRQEVEELAYKHDLEWYHHAINDVLEIIDKHIKEYTE